jgi:hypothetical protein
MTAIREIDAQRVEINGTIYELRDRDSWSLGEILGILQGSKGVPPTLQEVTLKILIGGIIKPKLTEAEVLRLPFTVATYISERVTPTLPSTMTKLTNGVV